MVELMLGRPADDRWPGEALLMTMIGGEPVQHRVWEADTVRLCAERVSKELPEAVRAVRDHDAGRDLLDDAQFRSSAWVIAQFLWRLELTKRPTELNSLFYRVRLKL